MKCIHCNREIAAGFNLLIEGIPSGIYCKYCSAEAGKKISQQIAILDREKKVCQFDLLWLGKCGLKYGTEAGKNGMCATHATLKCHGSKDCRSLADHQCSYGSSMNCSLALCHDHRLCEEHGEIMRKHYETVNQTVSA